MIEGGNADAIAGQIEGGSGDPERADILRSISVIMMPQGRNGGEPVI